jgi:hypothetical protein
LGDWRAIRIEVQVFTLAEASLNHVVHGNGRKRLRSTFRRLMDDDVAILLRLRWQLGFVRRKSLRIVQLIAESIQTCVLRGRARQFAPATRRAMEASPSNAEHAPQNAGLDRLERSDTVCS